MIFYLTVFSVGIKPVDTTKPEIKRRKDLLEGSKENSEDLYQSSVSPDR